MERRAIGNMEEELSRTCMDTPARSLKGKTLGRFSAICVARSVETGPTCLSMWRVSTFQEVMSISVTSVVRSLTPNKSGACIARVFTLARSQSECWCELHNENLLVLECNNLPLIQSSETGVYQPPKRAKRAGGYVFLSRGAKWSHFSGLLVTIDFDDSFDTKVWSVDQ